jgi:hypothetical protein
MNLRVGAFSFIGTPNEKVSAYNQALQESYNKLLGISMNQESNLELDDEMRAEYDISGGVRGKYYQQYMQGTNVVLLDPDVVEVFRDSESVNQALRLLIDIAKNQLNHSHSGDPGTT